MAAGIFLTVGTLSTTAAWASPATTSTTSTTTAPADTTTTSPSAGTSTTKAPPLDTAATKTAQAPAAGPVDPTIIVHAGGVRAANGTVGALPNGAVFTATEVANPAVTATCTTSGGTCTITGLPDSQKWDVTETTPPPGYYLNPNLDSGSSSSVTTFPYTFRTNTLTGTTTLDVPGANPDGTFTSQLIPPATTSQTFSGLMATSLNDPAASAKCGLNIALVLDQSGSMAAGGKQASLITAANDTINALTGTPSTVAIYTFNQTTGSSVAKTSTINVASAMPLHNFINSLPAPQLGTNWDQGLAQVASGFDEVIFLTDGAPTGSRIRITGNNFSQSLFTDTEQGIFSANGIKAGGTRVVGIGIGIGTGTPPSGGTENLRAVSGPTQNQDFFLGDNANFGAILKALATGACNNQLTISKQIQDPSGALISPTPADANRWAFTNTISSGSTIASPVTTAAVNGTNGVASAAVTIPAGTTPTVTVTETLKGGYTFVGAQCSVGGVAIIPTPVSGTTATFTGAAAQPMACTFTNKRLPAHDRDTPSPAGPVGTSISDTATVTGGVNPTGTVTFNLFPPGNTTCTAPSVFTSTNSLSGGSATSGSFLTAAVGTYRWVATYNGDTNNAAVSSGCTAEPVTTTQATPAIATTPSTGGPVGTSIFDRATVTGGVNPTGNVTFQLFPPGNTTCTAPSVFTSTNALSGGSATSGSFLTAAVGTYRWVATYNGDTNNTTVSSGCAAEPVTITQATPAIATTPSAGGPVGSSIIDTATVTGGFNPTGTVTFNLFPPGNTTCSGTPAFTSTNPLSGGSATSAPPSRPPPWAPTTGSPPTTVTPTTPRSAPAARPSWWSLLRPPRPSGPPPRWVARWAP